jgi:hypothetical protein
VTFVAIGDADEYASWMDSGAARGGALVAYWLSHLDAHWRAALDVVGTSNRVVAVGNALDFVVRFLEQYHANGSLPHVCDLQCCTIVLSPAFVRTPGQTMPPVACAERWMPTCLRLAAADCLVDCAFVPTLDAFRARIGLKQRVKRVFDDWFMSSRVLCLYPAWLERADEPKTRIRVHQFDFPLAASRGDDAPAADDAIIRDIIERFTHSKDRLVVFVSATGNPPFAKRFFAAAAASMRALVGSSASVKAIVLTKHPDRLALDLPANTKHVPYVNLPALLRARKHTVVVHHGGVRCCAAGLRAGSSHVVVPAAFDQPYNAEILRRMGVARVIPMRKLTQRRLTRALRDVLGEPSDVGRRAEEVSRAYASRASDAAEDVARFVGRDLLHAA